MNRFLQTLLMRLFVLLLLLLLFGGMAALIYMAGR